MPHHAWDRKHLLGLEGLSAADLNELLDHAERLRDVAIGRAPRLKVLAERTIANLFFEDSTRTRSSFTLAARRLGADTLELASSGSSVSKGETIVDTALNIQAMGVHGMVVRSAASGAAAMIANAMRVPVVNAGDGRHEHPTQGLLDLLTLRQHLHDVTGRTIAIVGDINNSRVARSAIHGMTTLGANVIAIGPPTLVSKSFEEIACRTSPGKVRVAHDFDAVLERSNLDAIMMLRVQFERAEAPGPQKASHMVQVEPQSASLISPDYRKLYGLTVERSARLGKDLIIMHPGPINRGLEIDSEVADDPERSVILEQVSNGVAVRMAVLAQLLAGE